MQIILFQANGDPIGLEIPDDSDADTLYQLVAAEIAIPPNQFLLLHDDQPIGVGAIGLMDGSTVAVQLTKRPKGPTGPTGPAAAPTVPTAPRGSRGPSYYEIPADIKPDDLLALTRSHQELLDQFLSNDPELGTFLASGDITKVRMLMMKRFMSRHAVTYTAQQELKAYESDPTNPVYQAKIEEQIRLENIAANMSAALDHLPEAFGRVTMLYVNIEVNSHPVKAFVDSGAQSTIMSVACAEKCGITRLIDTRYHPR